ncbi:YdbH domain-containing protein [Opitutus sp. GAS368]|uniref:intermembrane phospholipid transport protein YdbH family protein n=1 Tax=Opitutus sp. GAS368 TaxID=1882749 RepID=UPI00087C3E47|nr:YdbH domain-containing protein [Opitutus sp. GAS368]SDR66255.1 Dicarboxylate transport [Opitutus sp. GAS368]
MTITLSKRRMLLGAAGLAVTLLTAGLLARQALTGLAVNALLQLAGASEIKFTITEASPWRVVVEDIGFSVRTQGFAAKRVTFTRAHWWTPSLGTVRVEQARVPITVDGSDTSPFTWSTYQNGQAKVQPWQTPLEELALDGRLVVKAAAVPAQEITVKLEARLTPGNTWTGHVQADGPGLSVQGEGSYDMTRDELAFKLPAVALDVKAWQEFVRRIVLLPGGAWELEGKFTGSAEGRLVGKKLTTTGTVRLRDGRASNTALAVTAEGLEANLEFTDFVRFATKPGTMRIREVRTGQLALQDLDCVFAFADTNKMVVSKATFKALGGTVAMEPFNYFLSLRELETVVLVEGIDVEQVMALTKDLPAKAVGRVNGRFPIRIDDSGLRLGTGWLELKPGVYAEIQFNANGLLTGGASPSSPSYAVLKKVESGLLKLKITEMRLDIRPPGAPPGRSAQLHLAGEPVDPNVKAPVILDLNVNGPLERLINLGLDSRVSFGSKP